MTKKSKAGIRIPLGLLSITMCLVALPQCCSACPQESKPESQSEPKPESKSSVVPRISWYGTLDSGLAEAKRTGKPILLTSAAPQCAGVPGMW